MDWLTASCGWGVFYYLRKRIIENEVFTFDATFFAGVFFIPFVWVGLFVLQGTYADVRRLYRMKIVSLTFYGTLICTVLLFFISFY